MSKNKKINCKNSCVYNYFLRGQAANSKLSKEDMIKDRRTLLQTSTSSFEVPGGKRHKTDIKPK